jgi:hypothetical protein
MNRGLPLSIAALLLATGCASQPPLYSWGSYEELIYSSYAQPGAVDLASQVAVLEKEFQQAQAQQQRMPPGWHAHLASLYYQLGQIQQARQALLREKAQFPESGPFVDRMLASLKG